MDYERKYKDALEKAKKLYEQGTITESLSYVFPELKESEDERTRNEIIAFVEQSIHRGGGTPISQEQEDKWIAWLEKQGEPKFYWKPTEEQYDAIDYAYNSCPDTERGNYYEGVLSGLIDDLQRLEKQGEQKVSVDDFKAKDWYVSKVDGKIRNITWSEDDEVGWTNTMIMIKEVASNHYTKDSVKLVIDWLKSLKDRVRPQPKQELSERDEEEFQIAIKTLYRAEQYDSAHWLESLKQRIGG